MQNVNVLPQPHQKMMEDHFTRICDELLYERDLYNTKSGWFHHRQKVRAELLRALGEFPEEQCPLNAEITGRLERDGYVIEKLLFQSRPGFYVTAAVYVPINVRFPAPAIICPHGHWQNGRYHPEVQARMIGLAKRGYVALSLDKVGYNEREPEGPHRTRNLFLVGMTVQGIQVWDNMRAIDYLCSRDDVDPERIGCTGASGGGNQTMYVSALDERIKACAPVCSVEMAECYMHKAACVCETIPGLLRFADLVDICGLIAPRALLLVHGILDTGFRVDSGRKAFLRLQKIYHFYDPAKLCSFVAYSGHAYNKEMREVVYAWFDRWLMGKQPPYPPELAVFPEDEPATMLRVCDNGLSEPCYSMIDIYKRISAELPLRIEISSSDEWQVEKQKLHANITACLGGWPERSPLEAHILEVGNISVGEGIPEIKAEKLYFHSEVDILIPAVLFHPQKETPDGFDVKIILTHDGKETLEPQDVISELQVGKGVFAIDARGVGETKSNKDLLFSSVVAGRPIQGMQAWDVRRAVDYLCSRADVRSVSLGATGSPLSGIVALIAAATDGRISEMQIDKLLLSYRRQEDFGGKGNLVIPSILKYADVADIAAMIAPRKLEIKEFIAADDKPPSADEIASTFERCMHIYSLLKANENLKLPL
jgi:cephalosporin-C deacetylase-like acetyl esterase